MSLFQNSVLKKYLKGLDTQQVQQAWGVYKAHFHNPEIQENIRNANEEQYQGEFLIDLFVTVLGYTKNPAPDYNLTTELKNLRGAKKADGAILKNDKAIAVIELKGTNTVDLDKVETQAFGYKNNQAGCTYVITSNFEKLRFYIDNAVEFEEFKLFQLTKARFEILYLCLAAEYLIKDLPKQIKNESLTKEENVTKELYKDYSHFRNEIFHNIQKENPQHDKLTLFNKTQKLLDRFLFIFFAEDRLLLPPNSIRSIINQWTDLKDKYDEYFPLYDRFKKYFGYMNTGYKGEQHEIFAYNGGLFEPDDILDTISIDDELLYKHSLRLSKYDFESEVSVNILGHIFEHSLTEIESIQAELTGEEIDKGRSRRKKDGVFYTPKYITKYIVDNTVGKLCEEKKTELDIQEAEYEKERKGRRKATIKKLAAKLDEYRQWLLQITICDPACGSGAFLNQALEFLIEEHNYIDELKAKLMGDAMILSEVQNTILENNLFGVDINEESVEIAKLSLWLRTAEKGRKLTSLNDNIKCGNSLIDDPEVAEDKAFDWQTEFPEVFANGGFDVVIGNPPYVFARGIDKISKTFLTKNYNCAEYQIDLYILFMERCLDLSKDNGLISLIIPNSWLNNVNLSEVRRFLIQNSSFIDITDMPSAVFADANVDTVIFTYRPICDKTNITSLSKCNNREFKRIGSFKQILWLENDGFIINISASAEILQVLRKIGEQEISLKHISEIGRGVGVYHKRVGHTKEFIASDPFQSNSKDDETFVPYIRGKHINYWCNTWNEDSYISYGDWLAEPREQKFFEGPRILLRQIPSSKLMVTYIDDKFIIDQSVFISRFNNVDQWNPKAIVAILASTLMAFYFRNQYSEFDQLFPKVKLKHFKDFPIAKNENNELILLADSRLRLTAESNKVKTKFLNRAQDNLGVEKVSKRMAAFYDYDFKTFVAELKKKKVKLSLSDQDEWEEYFTQYKSEINQLQNQIQKTDNEIDQMVYELYGLTEEEIKIVEEATG